MSKKMHTLTHPHALPPPLLKHISWVQKVQQKEATNKKVWLQHKFHSQLVCNFLILLHVYIDQCNCTPFTQINKFFPSLTTRRLLATTCLWCHLGSWSFSEPVFLSYSYLSRSLADRWGTTVDFTTSFLHSSWFSAFCSKMFHSRPVHSLMLFSHRFLCLPLSPSLFQFQFQLKMAS